MQMKPAQRRVAVLQGGWIPMPWGESIIDGHNQRAGMGRKRAAPPVGQARIAGYPTAAVKVKETGTACVASIGYVEANRGTVARARAVADHDASGARAEYPICQQVARHGLLIRLYLCFGAGLYTVFFAEFQQPCQEFEASTQGA